MTVRRAAKSDIAAILAIAADNATAAHWPEAEYVQALENVAARRTVLVAESEGKVNGFLVVHAIGHEWELENVAVAPASQRLGVARELLCSLSGMALREGAEVIFLEVRASNLAARKLYENAGFEQTGLRPTYYSNPVEDAVLYRFRCIPESLEKR